MRSSATSRSSTESPARLPSLERAMAEDLDKQLAEAAKDWWRHFTTPSSDYDGGWRQRNDMVEAKRRKLNALLRQSCGGDNDVRRAQSS